jgi:hypothetical protein
VHKAKSNLLDWEILPILEHLLARRSQMEARNYLKQKKYDENENTKSLRRQVIEWKYKR